MTGEGRLETLWRSYNAFGARDADALVAAWHPDGEWVMGPGAAAIGDEAFRGHERLREFVRRLDEEFWVVEADMREVREHGETLLVRGLNRMGIRGMDEVLDFPYGQVVEYRDGLIRRVTQTDDPPPGWEDASPLHS